MRAGHPEHPLDVMDHCRVRWGRVVSVEGDVATVRAPRLAWDGNELSISPPHAEIATAKADGRGFLPDLRPGDRVSLHWDWICDRLTLSDVRALERYTARHLSLSNADRRAAHLSPGADALGSSGTLADHPGVYGPR
jgi:hypothetical protein